MSTRDLEAVLRSFPKETVVPHLKASLHLKQGDTAYRVAKVMLEQAYLLDYHERLMVSVALLSYPNRTTQEDKILAGKLWNEGVRYLRRHHDYFKVVEMGVCLAEYMYKAKAIEPMFNALHSVTEDVSHLSTTGSLYYHYFVVVDQYERLAGKNPKSSSLYPPI